MTTTNYTITDSIITTQTSGGASTTPTFRNRTTTNFIVGFSGATSNIWGFTWKVEGY